MTQRERFKKFIMNQSKEKYLPFPISKTAFSASVLNREWATEVSHEEIRDVLLDCGCVPSIIIGEKEWFPSGHHLSLAPRLISEDGDARKYRAEVETPYGMMNLQLAECKRQSLTLVKSPVEKDEDFKKVIWYIKEVRKFTSDITKKVKEIRNKVGEDCLITFFLPQPYELYCIFNREEAILMEYDYPEEFQELQQEILNTVTAIIGPAIEGGADVLNFGSVGTELYSPTLFKKHLVESSIQYANTVRQCGGISSFHVCGRVQDYLDMGAFDSIKVDILEGVALAPVGNVRSLKEARNSIPQSTIIKGSIDLDFLRNANADNVTEEALKQIKEFGDFKHIISGACDLLYGTPVSNIKALSKACETANG